jgi:long-subunit fatty acid transport protein
MESQNPLGTWNVLNFNVKFDSRWSGFAEAQLRSLSLYDQFHYYEYKIGATYKLTDSFSGTAGIGSYNTFDEGGNFVTPALNLETRTWLQANIKNKIGRILFENRFRLEQRFTSNGFRNRYRLRLGAVIPLNEKTIKPGAFYANVWNEIFFTNREPFFERNRALIGFGYEISKTIAVQAGYIYQFDYRINDEIGRDFLNIAIIYSIDLKKKKEYQQSNVD